MARALVFTCTRLSGEPPFKKNGDAVWNTMSHPSNAASKPLLSRETNGRKFRLLGRGAQGLGPAGALNTGELFVSETQRAESLENVLDALQIRFGDRAPVLGRTFTTAKRTTQRDRAESESLGHRSDTAREPNGKNDDLKKSS